MSMSGKLLIIALPLCVATAWGQSNKREPHIGYLYPAGGQRGSLFEITAGGQFLKGVKDVYISGEGVRASVVRYVGRLNLDGEQTRELRKRVQGLWKMRQAELSNKTNGTAPTAKKSALWDARKTGVETKETIKLPDHPLLENLEGRSLRELAYLRNELKNFRARQPNAQIAETMLIEVHIDPGATPGNRELRLRTPAGLTNPMRFQVGLLPEIRETELNDPNVDIPLPEAPTLDLPVVLNGQIMPGDVDRFRFRAEKGQQLVIEAQARRLVPYLADAVPGWFQATLALYDDKGNEVAFADDYRFHPDPALFHKIRRDGEYELEIRDAIYRGREDFVYRIAVGEQPFITQMFPLGGRIDIRTFASIAGWNLPSKRLRLDTRPGDERIRRTTLHVKKSLSNEVNYAVDTLPECEEIEPNSSLEESQRITLPSIVNGRIAQPGDVDVFRFEGQGGDEVAAEVFGRRLQSPLDSLLRITDTSGAVLEWNDDHVEKQGHLHLEGGLLLHHADSYLFVQLPKDGVYYVHLADSQNRGGQAYAYRLRISPPRPDFALRLTPSSITVPAGRAAPITVYALRKDGFDDDIEVVLRDGPDGFILDGGRIPAGRDRVRMTLTAPPKPLGDPVYLQLEGRARTNSENRVSRPVVPSQDVTQAFLYRHLVPSQKFMVAVKGPRRRGQPIELVNSESVRIPEGGKAQVRIKIPGQAKLGDVRLELSEAPEGMVLGNVEVVRGGLAFTLKVAEGSEQAGLVDNLIVEAFTVRERPPKDGKGATRKQRISHGVLPAIPFKIVKR